MKNFIILIFCLIFLNVNAFAETRKYEEKDCEEIFNAINYLFKILPVDTNGRIIPYIFAL